MSLRRVAAIAAVDLRRLFRDRSNIFFILVFPLALVLVLGVQFGGDYTPRVAVVDEATDTVGRELVAAVADLDGLDVRVNEGGSRDALFDGLATGRLDAVVVVPPDLADTIASGGRGSVEVLTRPQAALSVRSRIEAVVSEASARLRAARALVQAGLAPDLETARDRTTTAATVAPTVRVRRPSKGWGGSISGRPSSCCSSCSSRR